MSTNTLDSENIGSQQTRGRVIAMMRRAKGATLAEMTLMRSRKVRQFSH
jgi:hypothetical protein